MAKQNKGSENYVDLANAGLFFILLATIYLSTPTIVELLGNFFFDLQIEELANGFFFPIPQTSHTQLYSAVFQLGIGIIVLHIIRTFLHLAFHSRPQKTISAVVGIGVWAANVWAINSLITASLTWITFFGYIVVFTGLGLVISSGISLLVIAAQRSS